MPRAFDPSGGPIAGAAPHPTEPDPSRESDVPASAAPPPCRCDLGLETEAAAEDLRGQDDAAAELDGAAAGDDPFDLDHPVGVDGPAAGAGRRVVRRRRADGPGR